MNTSAKMLGQSCDVYLPCEFKRKFRYNSVLTNYLRVQTAAITCTIHCTSFTLKHRVSLPILFGTYTDWLVVTELK